MFSIMKANFFRIGHPAIQIGKRNLARQSSSFPLLHTGEVSKTLCGVPALIICLSRNFHITQPTKLKTLFSEDQQTKITKYINEIDLTENTRTGRLRPLNKIVASRPETGPINNINDLLEKYSLTSPAAVTLCYAILKSIEGKVKNVKKSRQKRDEKPRKLKKLMLSVEPKGVDPKLISKFVAVTVAENYISFTRLLRRKSSWQTQEVTDWNAIDTTNLLLTDVIRKVWELMPPEECYVIHGVPTRGAFVDQNRFYGAVLSLICVRMDFCDDVMKKIFHVSGRAPAHYFNLIVGNEIVSPQSMIPQSMISNKLEGSDSSTPDDQTPDDHVFIRSLREVTFADISIVRYKALKEDMRESVCQSLLLGKAFVELLK